MENNNKLLKKNINVFKLEDFKIQTTETKSLLALRLREDKSPSSTKNYSNCYAPWGK